MKRKLSLALIAVLVLLQGLTVCASNTTTEGDVSSQIKSTKASTWVISVPDITLDAETGTGTGTVTVTADLGSGLALEVKPTDTIIMKQTGKSDITANVEMAKQVYSMSDLLDAPVVTPVTITSQTPLTAGTYTGALTYTVKLGEYVKTRADVFAGLSTYTFGDFQIGGYGVSPLKTNLMDQLANKYGVIAAEKPIGYNIWLTRLSSRPGGDLQLYEYMYNTMAALGTNYDAKDAIIIDVAHEVQGWRSGVYCDYGDYSAYPYNSCYVGVGFEYEANINRIKELQAGLGFEAPIIFIKRDFTYATANVDPNFQSKWDALFNTERMKAYNTGNVIMIDCKGLLTAEDYEPGGYHWKQSGHDKMEAAVEEALYNYYSK